MELREKNRVHLIELGLRLKEVRKSKSLTQKDFSHIGRVSVQSQKLYESGTRSPNTEYLYHLMTYGIDICYVVSGKTNETQIPLNRGINRKVLVEILKNIEIWSIENEHTISIQAKADLISLLYISFRDTEEVDAKLITGHLELLNS